MFDKMEKAMVRPFRSSFAAPGGYIATTPRFESRTSQVAGLGGASSATLAPMRSDPVSNAPVAASPGLAGDAVLAI